PRSGSAKEYPSWIQPVYVPRASSADIDKTVVQAIGAALPKLDLAGNEPETTPMGWPWNFLARKFIPIRRESPFQFPAIFQDGALIRGPGSNLAESGAGTKIIVCLGSSDGLCFADDPNLPLQGLPEESQTSLRMGPERPTFGRSYIRIK